jgi:hypothetical protein
MDKNNSAHGHPSKKTHTQDPGNHAYVITVPPTTVDSLCILLTDSDEKVNVYAK